MLKPTILKNGLTVLKVPKAGSRVTLIGFVTTTGSSMEEGYFPQGISHLIERLFWCGTDKHTSTRSLNVTLEGMGGNFTSITSQELTGFYMIVPEYHQYKALSMLAEVIQRSYFDTRDIDREKKGLIDQLKIQTENMEMEEDFLTVSNLYLNSSLGQPVQGTVESISAITQENILEYLAHQYQPNKSYLILGGSFESKPLMELVEQEWSAWNPRVKKFIEPMDFHPEDIGELPRIIYRQKGISHTYLVVSFLLDEGMRPKILINNEKSEKKVEVDYQKLQDQTLKKHATLIVLNALLGQGLSSRLWSKTVEEEMLFNRVLSSVVKLKQTGYLQISGQIENSLFSFGLESVLTVLEAFKKTTVSINELAKAKEYLKGKMILDQEDIVSSTFWLIENLIGSGLNFDMEDLVSTIEKVEAPEIRALANDLFTPEKLIITTLGTAKETRLVEKLIKKYIG